MPTDDSSLLSRKLTEVREHIAAFKAEFTAHMEALEELERDLVKALESEKRASTTGVLQKRDKLSSLDSGQMNTAHKLAISRGRASSRTDAEFKAAYRSQSLTLTTLSAKVGVDAALMSKYRRKLRRIPQDRAEAIAKIIPWPADAKHWPGGIVPKD